MTPLQIEQAVFRLEEVRIVIRAPIETQFVPFLFERKAKSNIRVADWLRLRIHPLIGDCQVVVIDGRGGITNTRTKMETLRLSYLE